MVVQASCLHSRQRGQDGRATKALGCVRVRPLQGHLRKRLALFVLDRKERTAMETKATERQQHFLALAATHAEDFKTRVAQHDREVID